MDMPDLSSVYNGAVSGVTQQDYCAKQVLKGLDPSLCAQRYEAYRARVQGKGQKWYQDWAHGKGSYGGGR